jgi:hypothetical protein
LSGVRAIHVDDLAHPRLPAAFRLANALPISAARRLARLDPASLLAAARRRERLDDFGDGDFQEPLRVLTDAFEREADLSPAGRFLTRRLLLGLLGTRLRLAELLREHPEIRDERVEAPLVVLGLPRTGTTHLHNLLSRHPSLRSLPYWESLEPIPAKAVREGRAPDLRRRRCAQALRFQHWVMPLFPAMHEMTADAPHEEIQLLAADFRTMLFDASTFVPSYGAWYEANDQTSAYRYLKLLLQALQWLRGPRRWVLKSPQHLDQLVPLLAVFPDARVVHTHRDPVRVVASMCTMLAYGLRMQSARVDPRAVGRVWSERIARMLEASARDRAQIPRGQAMDLHFDAFLEDEVGAALRVSAFAGLPADPSVRRRFEECQAANPRGRHGAIDYRLGDLGLDADALRERMRLYAERYGVRAE